MQETPSPASPLASASGGERLAAHGKELRTEKTVWHYPSRGQDGSLSKDQNEPPDAKTAKVQTSLARLRGLAS